MPVSFLTLILSVIAAAFSAALLYAFCSWKSWLMGHKCDGMGEKNLRVKKNIKGFFFNLCQKGCDKQAKSDLQQLTSE